MRLSKLISSAVMGSLLTTIFISNVLSGEICTQCGNKSSQVFPGVDMKPLDVSVKASKDQKVIPFEAYQANYCLEMIQIEINQLGGFIREMEGDTPYSIDDYLQKPGCIQDGYGGNVKSPMLHLTADDPTRFEEFLQLFYRFYTMKRGDETLWLAAINAKNTLGETVLDYFEHQIVKRTYRNEESKKAVDKIIAFACSKGAVYSKYNLKQCPRESVK